MKQRELFAVGRRVKVAAVKPYAIPTLDEVRAYCRERKNNINPEQFFDFYEANGWVQGRGAKKIKNWQAAVRTWESMKGNFGRGNSDAATEAFKRRAARRDPALLKADQDRETFNRVGPVGPLLEEFKKGLKKL